MKKLLRVLRSWSFWISASISAISIAVILFSFTNLEITRNNFGSGVFFYEIITSGITIILTGIVFGLTGYKMVFFSKIPKRIQKTSSGFHGFISILGTFLSVLVTGCPACSITIATYIGISSFLTFLPFFGYELRIIGIFITFFAIISLWKNLESCSLKTK